jgi:hypothetical protein
VDVRGRTIWITDAHRDDGRRFVARAEEKLAAFVEVESAIRRASRENQLFTKSGLATQFAPQASQAEQSAAEQRNC